MFNMPCISAVRKTFSYVDGKKTGQFGDTASLQERIHTAEHMPGIEIVD